MAPLEPKPPDPCLHGPPFTHWSPICSSQTEYSHSFSKLPAHDFHIKHSFRVIGTPFEFSNVTDAGFYELYLIHPLRSTKNWSNLASQMKFMRVFGSQKIVLHRTDRRSATPIARSAVPETKYVYGVKLFKPFFGHAPRLIGASSFHLALTMKEHRPSHYASHLVGFSIFLSMWLHRRYVSFCTTLSLLLYPPPCLELLGACSYMSCYGMAPNNGIHGCPAWNFGWELGLDIVQSCSCTPYRIADASSWFLIIRVMIITTLFLCKTGCLKKNLDRLIEWACWMLTSSKSNLFTIVTWSFIYINPCWMRSLIICYWKVMFTLCVMSKLQLLRVTPCVQCQSFSSHTPPFLCYGLTIMFSSHAPSCPTCICKFSTHAWVYCSISYVHLDSCWFKLIFSIDSVASRCGEKPTLLRCWLGYISRFWSLKSLYHIKTLYVISQSLSTFGHYIAFSYSYGCYVNFIRSKYHSTHGLRSSSGTYPYKTIQVPSSILQTHPVCNKFTSFRSKVGVHHSKLQPFFVVSLYALDSVMVREMPAEINLSCISKTLIQTAFGPRQLYVYILSCFLFVMTPPCAENYLLLFCFAKGVNGVMSECWLVIIVAPFQVEQHNGSHSKRSPSPLYLSMMNLKHFEIFFCSSSPFPAGHDSILLCANNRLTICRVDSDNVVFSTLLMRSPYYIIQHSIMHWTHSICFRISLSLYLSDKDTITSALGCNAHKQCWQFGSVSTDVELWLTLHISTCVFYCTSLCFPCISEFWGNVENPFWFLPQPSLLRLKNDRTWSQNDLCKLFARNLSLVASYMPWFPLKGDISLSFFS